MKKWTPIDEALVQLIWQCENEECKKQDCVALNPGWHQDNGTPICINCNRDMNYVRTEILITPLKKITKKK